MKIAILSRSGEIYSTKQLVKAAIKFGHEAEVIDYLRCYMNITKSNTNIYYKGKELTQFDAVIPRISPRWSSYGTSLVRQFEAMGTYVINPSLAINRSRNKLRAYQLLAKAGINIPQTGFAHDLNDTEDLIKIIGGAPLIIKLVNGSQGVGVVLAESDTSAESVIQAFRGINANIIVQEFIAEAKSSDTRCFVVGDKVVAAIKRQGAPNDFRSNLHRGGTASVIKLTKLEEEIAIKSAKIMGLGCAGVDLLQSIKGPIVLEVNSSPGLEGIEGATNLDIASLIIKFIEKKVRAKKKKRYEG